MSIEETNMGVVGTFFQALGGGDMETAASLAADDMRWTYHGPRDVIPFAGEFTGMAGVGDFFGRFMSVADPVEMTPKDMWASGNMVFSRGIETSKGKASGKQYSVEWVHVIEVKDGKIATFDEYLDTASVAATLAG